MEVAFHHFGIVVPDIEKATKFYQQALGFKEQYRFSWEAEPNSFAEQVIGIKNSAAQAIMLEGPNCHLELFEYSAPEPRGDPQSERASDRGIAHLAFTFDDIDAAWQRFKDAGGVMHSKPVRLDGLIAIYCRDPFGNIIELMQPLDGTS
jgi:glyoxylase I family protein